MASNNVTGPEEFENGPVVDGGSPLWVSFVLAPENPEEEEIIPVRLQVQRSLLSSEESAKTIIPLLLSRTALPELFHHCPAFIKEFSEFVCNSLASDVHHVYVYGHVVCDDVDPNDSFWWFYLSTEDLISSDEQVMMSHRRSESAVEAVKEVKLEEASECTICLQDLLVGIEAAKLPCSHVYHRPCIVKWFDRSNQCPLCRSWVAA